ncbi:MAG: PIN domain-containing protein [Thermoleophilia bacterium]|nr:PIN domain-containing protein [Thermoleophilia bacterium]
MAVAVLSGGAVVALLDPADRHHDAAVRVLSEADVDEFLLPSSSLAECLVAPCRVGSEDALIDALADAGIGVVPVTAEIAILAARLRARATGVRLSDALVIATAEDLGAMLLAVEPGWATISDQVRPITTLW